MPKLNQTQFDNLLARIRAGNQEAAAELVRLYEPEIRREIRLRLTDAAMRRTLDSTDICQSVMANFFEKIRQGQLRFDRPEDLLRLLMQMVRNKLVDRHRRHRVRSPRDGQAMEDVDAIQLEGDAPSPSRVVANQELLERVKPLLSHEELQVLEYRVAGYRWVEISEKLDESAEALRKRLARTRARLVQELDVEFDSL